MQFTEPALNNANTVKTVLYGQSFGRPPLIYGHFSVILMAVNDRLNWIPIHKAFLSF